ncbi:MAG: hypothetical protein AAF589_07390 [Planctomycetota bacterium]
MSPRNTLLSATALLAALALSPTAFADHDAAVRLRPQLPSFGMHTYHDGYGERVVRVRRGGIAWRLGLERGDTIVRLNRFSLRHRDAWHNALGAAMDRGGFVRLAIVDGRSGRLVTRQTQLPVDPLPGPIGPITPKVRTTGYGDRFVDPRIEAPVCEAPPFDAPGFRGGPEPRDFRQPPPREPIPRRFDDRLPPTAEKRRDAVRLSALLASFFGGRP